MEGKPVSASFVIDQVIKVFPEDLNAHGTLFGGRIMHMIDVLAMTVAKRHSGKTCITSGVDSVRYINPAHRGDILICRASVNCTWQTSMEVGVKVIAEDFRSLEQKDILSAYFTFTAIDDENSPALVVPVIPETSEQIARYEAAEKRRKVRLAQMA